VWQTDGVSLLRSRYMMSDLPSDAETLVRADAGELIWAEQQFEGSPVRTLFYPLDRLGEGHEAHVLQIAAPLLARNEMLGRAGYFLILLTTLLAGATFAGSWWLAGSAIRPIHAVIDQAEEIGGGSLDRGIQAYADTSEYQRLVEVLNTMLGRIHSAFESQRRFTADASHELKSPLTAMRGEIEIALRRPREAEEYASVLGSTLEEVMRLSKLTEDLLTLARSDAGALAPQVEAADAAEIAARMVDRLRPHAEAKGIDLVLDAPESLLALLDQGLLGQCVWNLTDNALKFADQGGHVRVAISECSGELILEVEDDGPGLGDLDTSSLFERFFRADEARARDPATAGTGLGLAIVKVAAEAHGGHATAENRSQGGARFTVRFPLSSLRLSGMAL
jgi:two-component system OmpR family sensor kinase